MNLISEAFYFPLPGSCFGGGLLHVQYAAVTLHPKMHLHPCALSLSLPALSSFLINYKWRQRLLLHRSLLVTVSLFIFFKVITNVA